MKEKNKIITSVYNSPCGTLLLGSLGNKLCLCDWHAERHRDHVDKRLQRILNAEFYEGSSPVMDIAVAQLDEYFKGNRQEFDVPLLFVGTDFQKKVWNVRTVANANGANSISIFAPCHRVIGSDHTLTGYGGGLSVKEYLLKLEKAI